MTAQIDLPSDGRIGWQQFEALPTPVRGWAWELRSGRLELTYMPVTVWHWFVVMAVLEYWRDQGHAIAGKQYAADWGHPRPKAGGGFLRGDSGKHNVVADGVVFRSGYVPEDSRSTHEGADIHVVIEAVSADSEERDTTEKREIYAMLGIPNYWIVRNEAGGPDREGLIAAYELVDGVYRLSGYRLVSQLKGATEA